MKPIYFTSEEFASTNVSEADEPEHDGCAAAVTRTDGGRWRCTHCGDEGFPRWKHAIDLFPPRWSEQPLRAFAAPPRDTERWEEYLTQCFPDGFFGMLALQTPGHPIDPRSTYNLCHGVTVQPTETCIARLTMWSSGSDKTYVFPEVDHLEVISPGVIAFHDRQSGFSRLDGHLTVAERAEIAAWRLFRYRMQ